ncbi:MAG: hypothetical protein Q8N68_01975 [bacterium]|nr:hypothetical protein [bacterium]
MLGVGLFAIVALVIVTIVMFYHGTSHAKAKRASREEAYRKEEEKRKKENEAEAKRKERQMEKLRKYRFVVYIREKDGRKTYFETVLIRAFLERGLTVEPFSDENGRAVADGNTAVLETGLLALVGTLLHNRYSQICCDWRLLARESDTGEIFGAGYNCSCEIPDSNDERILANTIISGIDPC